MKHNLGFSPEELRKSRKASTSSVCVSAQIRTAYLPNKNLALPDNIGPATG
jgi:hypothetical protein